MSVLAVIMAVLFILVAFMPAESPSDIDLAQTSHPSPTQPPSPPTATRATSGPGWRSTYMWGENAPLITAAVADLDDDRTGDELVVAGEGERVVLVTGHHRSWDKRFLHKDQKKLSSTEDDQLNFWKEFLSSGRITYRWQHFQRSADGAGPAKKILVKTVTPFGNVFIWSTNNSSNTDAIDSSERSVVPRTSRSRSFRSHQYECGKNKAVSSTDNSGEACPNITAQASPSASQQRSQCALRSLT